jgi:hypothetical protein
MPQYDDTVGLVLFKAIFGFHGFVFRHTSPTSHYIEHFGEVHTTALQPKTPSHHVLLRLGFCQVHL